MLLFMLIMRRFCSDRRVEQEGFQEARQLVQTYAGDECETVPVGPNRRLSQNAATYFGSGAVQQIKEMLDAQPYHK